MKNLVDAWFKRLVVINLVLVFIVYYWVRRQVCLHGSGA